MLVELNLRANMHFLRVDIDEASKTIVADKVPIELAFLYQPTFMSSRVFVPSMLDTLLYQVSSA